MKTKISEVIGPTQFTTQIHKILVQATRTERTSIKIKTVPIKLIVLF